MAYSILVPDTEWSSQTVTLGGTTFILELKYKQRTERWYMSLFDADGNPILSEKKLVQGQTLTGLYDIVGMYGDIFCERVYGLADYPTRDTLGLDKEFVLVYYTEEEMDWMLQMTNNRKLLGL